MANRRDDLLASCVSRIEKLEAEETKIAAQHLKLKHAIKEEREELIRLVKTDPNQSDLLDQIEADRKAREKEAKAEQEAQAKVKSKRKPKGKSKSDEPKAGESK